MKSYLRVCIITRTHERVTYSRTRYTYPAGTHSHIHIPHDRRSIEGQDAIPTGYEVNLRRSLQTTTPIPPVRSIVTRFQNTIRSSHNSTISTVSTQSRCSRTHHNVLSTNKRPHGCLGVARPYPSPAQCMHLVWRGTSRLDRAPGRRLRPRTMNARTAGADALRGGGGIDLGAVERLRARGGRLCEQAG